MIGRVIGQYKIVEKLGEGGMGAVYKGIDTMLDREVAIKSLRPELASQTAIVERFRSEAVTLAKLNHPNIATLYALFRQGDELYMVLEYVRGQSLDEILSRRGALDADEFIPVFCQILDGINHAHDYGIIHRDIKPANMMLTEAGQLKVLDFGIARLLGSNRMTRAGNIIGTLEYMAPEQVKGLETDARSDTYALGMMLYEVLTGRAPFDTENEFELMKLQTESYPPEPRTIKTDIPDIVEQAIMRAIKKEPDERFQTAGDFREFLLDAGFAERGAMRRITDPGGRAAQRRVTPPPVSHPDTLAPPVAHVSEEFLNKETRLATPGESIAAVAAVVTSPEAKETRLGESALPAAPVVAQAGSGSSFFANLTWIHYAVAGAAGALLLAMFLIVPIVIFSLGSSSETPAANGPKNSNAGADVRTLRAETPTPEPLRSEQPVTRAAEPTATPLDLTPIESTPRETEPARPGQPPKRAAQPPSKRPTKPATKPNPRCALTGDC